ncbi:tRNA (adenosine(37)-N6)-threonylcarbamoyltransferase complex dimerization subunit type 1 TsaB [Maribacter sp. 2210JD10-5]|uniref:tRNA (adenosine(37)-N6)-threonylcarbamoyltransferase complex dimerization subunit type 1 TsaB n=1 Tax=Maribacter sp. 2210JD10-5 TaxID=3386272 RepID=UPI0039BD6BE6
MGLILNLETATTNCSVSLAKNGETLAIKEHNSANYSHAEQLHLFIQDCFKETDFELSDLNAIAVSKGPGSYTGLRIGVSAAKGLCYALEVPLISVPTLKSMAAQVQDVATDLILPVLDARRMEVYSAIYDTSLNEVRETRAEVINESSFSEYYTDKNVLVVGSGAEKIQSVIKHQNLSFDIAVIPSAVNMGTLSHFKFLKKDFEDVAYFEPYYLKDFILQKPKKQNSQ